MGQRPRLATVTVKRCGFALLTFQDHAMRDGRMDQHEKLVEAALMDAYRQAKATDDTEALCDLFRRGVETPGYKQRLIDVWQSSMDELPETAA